MLSLLFEDHPWGVFGKNSKSGQFWNNLGKGSLAMGHHVSDDDTPPFTLRLLLRDTDIAGCLDLTLAP